MVELFIMDSSGFIHLDSPPLWAEALNNTCNKGIVAKTIIERFAPLFEGEPKTVIL